MPAASWAPSLREVEPELARRNGGNQSAAQSVAVVEPRQPAGQLQEESRRSRRWDNKASEIQIAVESAEPAHSNGEEKRYDGGEGPFSFSEFLEYYGGHKEALRRWKMAASLDAEPAARKSESKPTNPKRQKATCKETIKDDIESTLPARTDVQSDTSVQGTVGAVGESMRYAESAGTAKSNEETRDGGNSAAVAGKRKPKGTAKSRATAKVGDSASPKDQKQSSAAPGIALRTSIEQEAEDDVGGKDGADDNAVLESITTRAALEILTKDVEPCASQALNKDRSANAREDLVSVPVPDETPAQTNGADPTKTRAGKPKSPKSPANSVEKKTSDDIGGVPDGDNELFLNVCAQCGETFALVFDLGSEFICEFAGEQCFGSFGPATERATIESERNTRPECNFEASTLGNAEDHSHGSLDLRTRLLLQGVHEKLSTFEVAELMSKNGLEPSVDKNEFKVALAAAREHQRQRDAAASREQDMANRQHERFLGNQVVKVKSGKFLEQEKESREQRAATSISLRILGSHTGTSSTKEKKKGPRS